MPDEPVVVNKCPWCFRNLGTWKKDPILTPYGSKFKWTDQTTLEEEPYLTKRLYVGMYQIAEEIKEIQDYLKTIEAENLPEAERTEFSPINNTGYFQIKGTHIKEMRESVEKLLVVSGQTLQDFFNHDEGGNHIDHPNGDKYEWTDDVINEEDWDKFQIKAIHIEELRHFIAINDVIGFFRKKIETIINSNWNRVGAIVTITKSSHGLNTDDWITITESSDYNALSITWYKITKIDDDTFSIIGEDAGSTSGTCKYTLEGGFVYKFLDKEEYTEVNHWGNMYLGWYGFSFACDTAFFYFTRRYGTDSSLIIKCNKLTGNIIEVRSYDSFNIGDIAVDDKYIWAISNYSTKMVILRINKNNISSFEVWIDNLPKSFTRTIVCDKNYLYFYFRKLSTLANFLYKYKKDDKSYVTSRNLSTNPLYRNIIVECGIGIDKEYIYTRAYYTSGSGENIKWHVGVMKITKDFNYEGFFEVEGQFDDLPEASIILSGVVVAGENNIYVIHTYNGGDDKMYAYSKSGIFRWNIVANNDITGHVNNYILATTSEYQITLSED